MKTIKKAAILGAFWCTSAFALTSNCPTATSTFTPGTPAGTFTIAGAGLPGGSANSINDLNALTQSGEAFTTGCGYIDKVFTQFSVADSLQNSFGGNNLATIQDGLYTAFQTQNSGSLLTFSDVRGTAGNGSDKNANDGNRNFNDFVNGANSFNVTFIVSMAASASDTLRDFRLYVNGVALTGTGTASVTTNICTGYTGLTVTNSFSTCSSGSLLTNTLNLANGNNSVSLVLGGVNRIAISQTFTFNAGTSGTAAFVTYADSFNEVPEPGTLGMLGAGLLGFGLLAGRKRS